MKVGFFHSRSLKHFAHKITKTKRMKRLALCVAALSAGIVMAAQPAATALVSVDLSKEEGPVKPMYAVNNGPSVKKPGGDQKNGNFEDYKAARIPFARTHDSINCVSGGAHTCDISAIFPDFDVDGAFQRSPRRRERCA